MCLSYTSHHMSKESLVQHNDAVNKEPDMTNVIDKICAEPSCHCTVLAHCHLDSFGTSPGHEITTGSRYARFFVCLCHNIQKERTLHLVLCACGGGPPKKQKITEDQPKIVKFFGRTTATGTATPASALAPAPALVAALSAAPPAAAARPLLGLTLVPAQANGCGAKVASVTAGTSRNKISTKPIRTHAAPVKGPHSTVPGLQELVIMAYRHFGQFWNEPRPWDNYRCKVRIS
jgi:hypothetical protein